jgi:hypothetical protein
MDLKLVELVGVGQSRDWVEIVRLVLYKFLFVVYVNLRSYVVTWVTWLHCEFIISYISYISLSVTLVRIGFS